MRTVTIFYKSNQANKHFSREKKIFGQFFTPPEAAEFIDMGFRNNLMENMNNLAKRSDSGAIVENAVFIRLNKLSEGMDKINFYRTKAGAEVDFVLHNKGEIVPIEVKFSSLEREKVTRSLASFIDSFKPEHAVVLTKNYWGKINTGKTEIMFMPVYYL